MAYDEELARRYRDAIGGVPGISERRMMGATCFMVNGNMIGAADRTREGVGRFMFRVGKDNEAKAETLPGAEPMVMGGRSMHGFFFVEADDCDEATFRDWLSMAMSHAMSLPPK